MGHDYKTLVKQDMVDFSALLHSLDDEQWDHPSLCSAWRVRDVIGHICTGYLMKLTTFPLLLVKYRGNIARGSHEIAVDFGTSHTPAQILSVFDAYTAEADTINRGLVKMIKPSERMTDHLIHQQDVRRPLGLPREVPAERIVAALDALPTIGGFLKSKKKAAGLRFVATDVEWTYGTGPEVRGPGESLVLALSGRPAGLDGLEGDGADELRRRVAPAAA